MPQFDTHSFRCYQDIMTFFISLYIVLGTGCVNLLSAEPEISVSGPVGSTAVLPCQLTSGDTDSPYIKWQIKNKTDYKIVLEREGEESYSGEEYKDRVDVPEEELRKGNCSLVMRDLRLTDTGVYTGYQAVTNTKSGLSVTKEEISRVHLTVHDRPEETLDEKSTSSDNRGWNHHYLWILVFPGLVLLGLIVWRLRRRNIY